MRDIVFNEPEYGIDPPVKQVFSDAGVKVDPDTVEVIIKNGRVTIRVYDQDLTDSDATDIIDAIESEYTDAKNLGQSLHTETRGWEISQRMKERMGRGGGN